MVWYDIIRVHVILGLIEVQSPIPGFTIVETRKRVQVNDHSESKIVRYRWTTDT